MSDTKVNVSVVKKGVSGAPVIKLGVGKSNEMAPRGGAFNSAVHGNTFSYNAVGSDLGNYKSTGPIDNANKYYSSTTNTVTVASHGFKTGDYVVCVATNSNIPWDDSITFTNYTLLYIIKVDDDNIQLATTKANADAGTEISISTEVNLNAGSEQRFFRVHDFLKLKNTLYDYNDHYPTYNIFPDFPRTAADNWDPTYNTSGFLFDPLPHWRAVTSTLLPIDFSGFIGTRFYENEFPYKDTGINPGTQFRVIGLYGAGTSIPGSPVNQSNPEWGVLNPNNISFNAGAGNEEIQRVGAVAQGSSHGQNVRIPGATGVWVKNEWQQDLTTIAEGPQLSMVKAGGKFKVGCKVRVPRNDMLRSKNFGGFYVSMEYFKTSAPTTKTRDVYYVAIKRADHTLNIPDSDGHTLTATEKKYNWRGLSADALNERNTVGGASIAMEADYVQKLGEYNAEDLADFKSLDFEIPVPTGFKDDGQASPDGSASIAMSFNIYYHEAAEHLEGLGSSSIVLDSGTFASNMTVGKRYVIQEAGTESLSGGGDGLAKWRALGVLTGTPARGTIFRCISTASVLGSDQIAGAEVYEYDVTDEVNSSQIVAGNNYFIRELGSQLTQSAMHTLAGTTERQIEPSINIRQGGTYTIVNHDENGTEQWSSVFMDNGDGTEVRLTESDEFARRALNGDGLDGMAFKCSKIEGAALNGNATIRTGGYPVNTSFTALDTTGISQGFFVQGSGVVQFYSPYVEYIPPDQV